MSNFTNQKSSLRPTYVFDFLKLLLVAHISCSNARQSVGDGAASFDTSVPSVLAVCHLEGNDDMYYYSTTFSGGPGVCLSLSRLISFSKLISIHYSSFALMFFALTSPHLPDQKWRF